MKQTPIDHILDYYDIERDRLNMDMINNRIDSDEYKCLLESNRAVFKARILRIINKKGK